MYEAAIRQGGGILTYELDTFFDLLDIYARSMNQNIQGMPFIITNA